MPLLVPIWSCSGSSRSEIQTAGHDWGAILQRNATCLRSVDYNELARRFDFSNLELSVRHTDEFASQNLRTDRDLVSVPWIRSCDNYVLFELATHQDVPLVVLILEINNRIIIRANEQRLVIEGDSIETEWKQGRVYEAWLSPDAASRFVEVLKLHLATLADQEFATEPGYPEVYGQGYSLNGIRIRWDTRRMDLIIYGRSPLECIVKSDPCVQSWVDHDPSSPCDLPVFEFRQFIIATWVEAFCERALGADLVSTSHGG